MAGPLIETRLQITKDSFTGDYESLEPAERLTKTALHRLLDGRLKVKYDQTDRINSWRTKIAIDSLLNEFTKAQYTNYSIKRNLPLPTKANLILIPYLIWTRTTREFDSEKCGRRGRNYILNNICYWTRSEAYIFMISLKTRELIYFKSKSMVLPRFIIALRKESY